MATDTKVKELIINKLTKAQFDSIEQKKDNELYLIEDDDTFALKSEVPTQLSELTDDATHRVVTDDEKNKWSNKLNTSDNGLATSAKTIVGAINELHASIGSIASMLDTINGKII